MQRAPEIVQAVQGPCVTWFDYVLDHKQFEDHILELKKNPTSYPTSVEMVRMFLRPILQTDEENKENARCKKLRDLLSQVILLLDVSFSEIEKNIPLEHQIILLQSLRNSQDNNGLIVLHRWILQNKMHSNEILDVEESISDSVVYLTNIIENNNENCAVAQLAEINFELGEFYFSNEDFSKALKFFSTTYRLLKDIKEKNISTNIDYKQLQNFQLACQSVIGSVEADAVHLDTNSLVFLAEKARLTSNIEEMTSILLKDITDKFLFLNHLSLSYRKSIDRYFPNEKYKIHCCNSIAIIIHQMTDELGLLKKLDFKDIKMIQFLFQTCKSVISDTPKQSSTEVFISRLETWLRSVCYVNQSVECYNEFKKQIPELYNKEDENNCKTILNVNQCLNTKIEAPFVLPLKRNFIEFSSDSNNVLSKAKFYFSAQNFEIAKDLFDKAGVDGKYGALACKLKKDENTTLNSLADELYDIISKHNIMPSLELLEYFIGTLLTHSKYEELSKICSSLDSLRCQLQQTNQDLSLSMIGTICDFINNVISFQKAQSQGDNNEIPKLALTVIALFWKPYLATKITLRYNEGLLMHIKDTFLLQNLLSSIVTLLFVNNVKNDPNFEEKSFPCPEHYPKFEDYKKGYTEYLGHPDQRFSSRISPDGGAILSQIARAITQTLLSIERNNSLFLLQHADLTFEEGKYQSSLVAYLKAGAVETSFFSDPSGHFRYSKNTLNRMIHCLHGLQGKATSQAIVMSQMVPMGDCQSLYRIAQSHPQTLNSKYFQYLWHIPLLELLVSVYKKLKDEKTCNLLIQIIQKPEINQNNPNHIHNSITGKLTASFLKELLRDFLGHSQ